MFDIGILVSHVKFIQGPSPNRSFATNFCYEPYAVEKLRFLAKSENICPHSSNEDFLRGVQLKWASDPVVAFWSLSRVSSQNFSKEVLWAEILKIAIWEFFNRISP